MGKGQRVLHNNFIYAHLLVGLFFVNVVTSPDKQDAIMNLG